MTTETEIRALVPSVKEAIERLEASGFRVRDSVVQQDVMYDYPDGTLFKDGQKIRVRIEGKRATLTYKGKFQRSDGISQRDEIDIPIDTNDTHSLGRLLEALGYPMLFQVRKNRTTLINRSVQATIDEWPIIGPMLEFEGLEGDILKCAASIFPELEFGNPRLKDLFESECKKLGKTLSQLKSEYQKDTGFDLGNIEFLLR